MKKIFVLALLLFSANASAQRIKIVVGGPNFRPYPVAVPDILTIGGEPDKKQAAALTAILQTYVDLARSLELVPPKTYLATDKESWSAPQFANWVNVGASGLIRGGIEVKGDNTKITLRFYDVVAQRELLNRSYQETKTTAADAITTFLDELIRLLTGEEGIFSSKIAYIKSTGKGKALFVSDMDGHRSRRLTDPDGLALLPSWSAKGESLLFTSYIKGNPDLYRINLRNNNLESLSNKRGLNTGAAVSPDGKRVALTLSMDGNTEIYVMNADGSNLNRLTDSFGQDVSPSWSPDGSRIAFVSSRSGQPHIYVMNADGSAVRRLTFRGNYNQEPDWSPRAEGQIAFTARDERLKFDIFLVHPTTGDITRLTQDEGNNESPSHSPDGHHIVFTSTRPPGGNRNIYIMDVDGENQRRMTKDGGDYENPAWGPRHQP